MGPKTKELILTLKQLIHVLDKYEVEFWSKWMCESLRRLESSDFSGITHLLGAYGGMGSFNDCVLVSADSGQSKQVIVMLEKDNYKLSELSNRVYVLANDIIDQRYKREYQSYN